MARIIESRSEGSSILPVSKDLDVLLDASKRITHLSIQGIEIKLPLELKEPEIHETERGRITVEDLVHHPMNLSTRWPDLKKEKPDYKVSDHQNRFIVTFENGFQMESYVIPKVFENGEPLVKIAQDVKRKPRPFTVEMAEIINGEVIAVNPEKPKEHAKILHGTQILGHVQDAANIQRWANANGSLTDNWQFALPATARTVTTIDGLVKGKVPADEVTINWSYPGGKDFRTGKDFRSDFNTTESFSSVVGFAAANARLCLDVAKGEFAVVSSNFRAESQILREVNPNILTAGITYTFLTGKPGERIKLHSDLPRFGHMLQRVQSSLDSSPQRIAELNEDPKYVDDWWRISSHKIRDLDLLLYRSFDLDPSIPSELNGKTKVVEIPHPAPEVTFSHEEGREYIGGKEVLGQPLRPEERVIILAGESDDGSFRRRAEEVMAYATAHPEIHVIMPLTANDKRIAGIALPQNAHPLGFRNDWHKIIPGGDIAFLRGSWGEMLDVVASGTVPLITSLGTVPMDSELDNTQFLTEVSGERACNTSLLIKALQKRGVSAKTINGLLVDWDNPNDQYSLQEAISFALQPEVAEEVRPALLSIQGNGVEWIGKLHEQLLNQRRAFKRGEVDTLHKSIWSSHNSTRRHHWLFSR